LLIAAVSFHETWQITTYLPVVYSLLSVLVVVLALARSRATCRRQRAQQRPVSRWAEILSQVSWGYPLAGLLRGAWCGIYLYTGTLRTALAASQGQVAELQAQLHPVSQTLVRRIRPKHPPRMSGEYYRGNDERNAALFNGGFYRTCTLRVGLVQPDG